MICFRDVTYCPFYKDCFMGDNCTRALTDTVKKEAKEWWGNDNAPICEWTERPPCFKEDIV